MFTCRPTSDLSRYIDVEFGRVSVKEFFVSLSITLLLALAWAVLEKNNDNSINLAPRLLGLISGVLLLLLSLCFC